MTGRAPTIVEVASLAGVSKSTVSNVIRGSAPIAESTRRRVLDSIDRLGYRPNALARQLREQRSRVLGVLIGDLDNPYYGEIGALVERAAFHSGLTAMFCNIEAEGMRAEAGVQMLLEQRVAGVAFLAFSGRSPRVRTMLAGIPTVSIGLREDWGDCVAVDDARGSALAAEHLTGLGHRRIGYLTSAGVEPRTDRARREGARGAVARAGLELATIRSVDDPALRDVTAVFCANDLAAISLLDHADRHGIDVPGDLSVVGFDDVSIAGLGRISLTTVAQPLGELARTGIELLRRRVDGELDGEPIRLAPELSLVVRGSTAPPAVSA
jgi:DNA-binding LacI/PurR family transcriptional regulator